MALLFMDGFDHSGTTAASHATKYGSSSSPTLVASPVRTGTGALRLNAAGEVITKPLAATGGFVLGVAFQTSAFAAGDLIQVREGATVHLVVAVDASGHLVVKVGSTTLATGSTVLTLNNWVYLEFKGVIHDTTGSYTLRIDGVNELTASGLDTRNAGSTGQWDRVRLVSQFSSQTYDDLYISDQSGSAPTNDFLGVCKVETVLPQTDAVAAGSNAGLTCSTGTDHGALVDENPPNTTDYTSSPTVGAKDTYHYPSLALTGAILGIQTNLYVAKSDAAARSVCAVVRASGTDYDGANVSPGTTFGYVSEVRALNPATGLAWTSADFDALQAGMKVTG